MFGSKSVTLMRSRLRSLVDQVEDDHLPTFYKVIFCLFHSSSSPVESDEDCVIRYRNSLRVVSEAHRKEKSNLQKKVSEVMEEKLKLEKRLEGELVKMRKKLARSTEAARKSMTFGKRLLDEKKNLIRKHEEEKNILKKRTAAIIRKKFIDQQSKYNEEHQNVKNDHEMEQVSLKKRLENALEIGNHLMKAKQKEEKKLRIAEKLLKEFEKRYKFEEKKNQILLEKLQVNNMNKNKVNLKTNSTLSHDEIRPQEYDDREDSSSPIPFPTINKPTRSKSLLPFPTIIVTSENDSNSFNAENEKSSTQEKNETINKPSEEQPIEIPKTKPPPPPPPIDPPAPPPPPPPLINKDGNSGKSIPPPPPPSSSEGDVSKGSSSESLQSLDLLQPEKEKTTVHVRLTSVPKRNLQKSVFNKERLLEKGQKKFWNESMKKMLEKKFQVSPKKNHLKRGGFRMRGRLQRSNTIGSPEMMKMLRKRNQSGRNRNLLDLMEEKKKEIVPLLDSQKSMNASIICAKIPDQKTLLEDLKVSKEWIYTTSKGQDILSRVRQVFGIFTPEEKLIVRKKGKTLSKSFIEEQLSEGDRFIHHLFQIPCMESKLDMYEFFESYESVLFKQVKPELEELITFCIELKHSEEFKNFLGLVLVISNFLNQDATNEEEEMEIQDDGSSRMSPRKSPRKSKTLIGISLRSLLNLGNVKNPNEKSESLMDVIYAIIQKDDPEILAFQTKFKGVHEITKQSQLDEKRDSIKTFRSRLKKIVMKTKMVKTSLYPSVKKNKEEEKEEKEGEEEEKEKEEEEEEIDGIVTKMESLIPELENKVSDIEEMLEQAEKLVFGVAEDYGHPKGSISDFFVVLRDFLVLLDKTDEKQKRLEKQKKRKEERERRKKERIEKRKSKEMNRQLLKKQLEEKRREAEEEKERQRELEESTNPPKRPERPHPRIKHDNKEEEEEEELETPSPSPSNQATLLKEKEKVEVKKKSPIKRRPRLLRRDSFKLKANTLKVGSLFRKTKSRFSRFSKKVNSLGKWKSLIRQQDINGLTDNTKNGGKKPDHATRWKLLKGLMKKDRSGAEEED